MNQISTTAATPTGGFALVPRNMQEAMGLADMMSKAGFLARELQTPGGALFVIEQSMRWNMSPFAVAMETSFIQGKPMFSGKIVAAAVTSSGAVVGRLNYTFSGSPGDRQVEVSGLLRGETEPRTITVRTRDAKTNNKVWQTQEDQQLAYHGSRVWARRNTPEVMLGVYAPEEFDDAPAAAPLPPASGPTIQGQAERAPPPPALIVLAPDGTERSAPSIQHWAKWCEAAIAKLEDATSVGRWRSDMAPHFLAAEHVDVGAVDHVQGVAQDRLDALADAGGGNDQ